MKPTRHSVALHETVEREALAHLIRRDGQEDVCFGLWYPSTGRARFTAVVASILHPRPGDREVHGNATLFPRYYERAVAAARTAGAGLVLMHSHPGAGWQGMSDDDVRTEVNHAASTYGATELPLLGMTLGSDGSWSARFWLRTGVRQYHRQSCTSVRAHRDGGLDITFDDQLSPRPPVVEEQTRTVSAWGEDVQAVIQRLHVGIVGAGSVGALVAEALARTGVGRLSLLDFDRVERVNLDRVLHATRQDAELLRPKVLVLAEALRQSASTLAFAVDPFEYSVIEDDGFRTALDCDVLFSCVDRPWPRQVLNFIAHAHLIPVIDGGISVETTPRRKLRRADWRAHTIIPGRRCLECLNQYDASDVALERAGMLDDPSYIQGLPPTHRLRRNENVFGFAIADASLEVLQFLSLVVRPTGLANPGRASFHFVTGSMDNEGTDTCEPECLYPNYTALGDASRETFTSAHPAAEKSRVRPRAWESRWRRASDWFNRIRRGQQTPV